jgi:hypothetical protein
MINDNSINKTQVAALIDVTKASVGKVEFIRLDILGESLMVRVTP